ncbi:MAG: TonB-dependent receptor [Sphingomicrobium sp.]
MAQQPQPPASIVDQQADRGPASQITDIVVTARKREESSQRIPISITAVNAADLERRQVRNLEGLSYAVPNLTLTKTQHSNNQAQIYLRGVGQDDASNMSVEPVVGLYVDGVPYTKSIGALLDIIEFDRIEVLRGPQGTLYGRNSMGGAIKFETKKPDPNDTYFVGDISTGSFNRFDARAAVNLPISDVAAVKFDFVSRSDDGYVRNAKFVQADGLCGCNEHLNQTDRKVFRLSGIWKPTSDLRVLASVDVTRDRSGIQSGIPIISSAVVDNLNAAGAVNRAAYLYGPRQAAPDVLNPNSFNGGGGALTVEYLLGFAQLRSITGYREFDLIQSNDPDGGPVVSNLVSQNGRVFNRSGAANNQIRNWQNNTFTQELQLVSTGSGTFRWVVGGFFMNERNRDEEIYGNFITKASGFHVRQTARSFAGYADISYKIVPQVELSVGARFTHDEKDYYREHYAALGLPVTSGAPYIGSTTVKWNKFTPRFAASWQPTERINLYGSWSRGYQAGAFQGFEFVSAVRSNTPVAPAVVDTTEFGLKTEWFDRRLRLNLAIFQSDYSNIPASIINANNSFTIVTNNVRIKGAELELSAVPLPGWTIYGSGSLLDNKYTKSVLAASFVPGENGRNYLKFSPKSMGNIGTEYRWKAGNVEPFFGGQLTYSGRYFFNGVNTPFGVQDSFVLLDAQAGLDFKHWSLVGGVKNLTDKIWAPQGTTQGGGAVFLAPPRTWSVTVKVRI